MSYSLKVVVKDGVATVASEGTTTGAAAPPDGVYNINGHFPSPGTWQAETISVMRTDSDGDTAIQSTSTAYVKPIRVQPTEAPPVDAAPAPETTVVTTPDENQPNDDTSDQ